MDGLTKPLYLGRLRLERLTSYQMVGQYFVNILEALPGGTTSPSISPRPQWAGPIFLPEHPSELCGFTTKVYEAG